MTDDRNDATEDEKTESDVGDGPMTPETLQSILRMLTQSAETFVDDEISPERTIAAKYYKGAKFGNEEEGRSQIVMTTVRDTILSVLPSLMRVFFGSERAVDFETHDPAGVEQAEQESAYVTHLFESSPNAMLNTLASLKDGLTKRLGFVKWWAETVTESSTIRQTGLVQEQLTLLEQDAEVSYTVEREYTAPDGTPVFDCSVTRASSKKVPRWEAVPPEEVLWNRDARAFNGGAAQLIVHRRSPTVGALVERGFEFDDLVEHAQQNTPQRTNLENIERTPSSSLVPMSETPDKSSWFVPFYEVYARIDEDGDHIPELRRYYLAGEAYTIVTPADHEGKMLGEAVREVPLACWCPDPEPHTIEGQSYADLTMDLQRVDTALVRGNLDSLGLALHGRVAYREGVVNPHDILNTEIGAAIRVAGDPASSLFQFSHAYVGKESFPLIEHIRRIREERTGYNMESQGLNAGTLQSSTKEGVTATLSAAQARTELIARLYLEQIMVPLFKGLRGLAKEHQDHVVVKRIRGKFVVTDPRLWVDQCDVRVNLMLGGGLAERRIAALQEIVLKQEQVLGTLGPSNPLVNLAQYSRAVLKLIETAGHPDAEQYFSRISDQQAAAMTQQAAQAPPKPDPATMMMQAEIALKQGDQQLAKDKLQLETQKFLFEQQLETERLRQDFVLKEKELELKYTARLDEMQMQDFIEGRRTALGDARAQSAMMQKSALALQQQETDADVAVHTARVHAAAKVEVARVTAASS